MDVGRLNKYLLQWFGFRLGRIFQDGEQIGWTLIGPVLPFTGWKSNFKGRDKPLFTWKCRKRPTR